MKIEKLNDNQIRCTLTAKDLEERHIRVSELAYGSEKAKALFRDMLITAYRQYGFSNESNTPLMIEATPDRGNALILTITKVDDPEELDTRFARFSPTREVPDSDGGQSVDGADDILDAFHRLYESKKAAEKSSGNARESSGAGGNGAQAPDAAGPAFPASGTQKDDASGGNGFRGGMAQQNAGSAETSASRPAGGTRNSAQGSDAPGTVPGGVPNPRPNAGSFSGNGLQQNAGTGIPNIPPVKIGAKSRPGFGKSDRRPREEIHLTRICRFDSLEKLIRAAGALGGFYQGENTLYRIRRTKEYVLVIHQSNHTPEDFNRICNILSEYGSGEPWNAGYEAHLAEHEETVLKADALEELALLKS